MVDKKTIPCDVCGKSFDSSKALEKHKDSAHNDTSKLEAIGRHKTRSVLHSKKLVIAATIGILLAISASLGVYSTMGINSNSQNGLTIDGIPCNTMEQLQFHIHAHLDVFVNGHSIYIPPQIGIVDDKCIYWLHTHDSTGIIHIESPSKRDFTLGQFFQIWKSKLNNSSTFEAILGGKLVPIVYVNGNKVPSSINYKDVKLNAHDEIAVIYGKPPNSIPSKYSFPEGL
jgi:hypothetical protein